jgi:hypothetical protein
MQTSLEIDKELDGAYGILGALLMVLHPSCYVLLGKNLLRVYTLPSNGFDQSLAAMLEL